MLNINNQLRQWNLTETAYLKFCVCWKCYVERYVLSQANFQLHEAQWICFEWTFPFGFHFSYLNASFSAFMSSVWYWFGRNKNFQSLSGVFEISILRGQPFRYKCQYKLTRSKLGYGMTSVCNRRSPIVLLVEIWPKVIKFRVGFFNEFDDRKRLP